MTAAVPEAPAPPPPAGEPALNADLATFTPQEVFAWLERTGKSGLVQISHREHTKSVWLHRGEVVFAASNQRSTGSASACCARAS